MNSLIKKRGVIKGKLTRAINLAEGYSNDIPAIDVWLENANQIEIDFENVQAQIEELATAPTNDEPDPQELERAQFEKSFFDLKLKLKQKRAALVTGENSSSDSSGAQSNAGSNNSARNQSAPRVKLPKVNLPIFSGDWKQWPSFYQLFSKLVHDEPAYTTIEKFFHLKAHLSGEAAERIDSIEIVEENYQDALDALKVRYDNQRLIVMKHLKIIFELPTVTTDSHLRSLVDAFNNSLRALAAQGLPTDQWDAILLYLVSSKLGPGIRRQWEITIDDSTQLPTLNELVAFLEQRAAASEVLAVASTSSDKRAATTSTSIKPTDSKQIKRDVKYAHLNAQSSCPICKDSHFAYQCRTYANSSLADREKLVAKHRLCGNCLNPKHVTSKCRSSKCKKCGEPHHTSLHKESSLNPNAAAFSGLAADQTMETCLPTACVFINQQTRRTMVRMVIDCGSQCTFITENLARRLHLNRIRLSSSQGNIEGVGGASATSTTFAAELTITSRHSPYQLTIFARILPVVTNYTPQLRDSVIRELRQQGLPLADEYQDDLPIDILLGAEYWAIIMQPDKRLASATLPPLLNSSFGWLVSGKTTVSPSTPSTGNICCFTLESQLRQFWELEDAAVALPPKRKLTPDELKCEKLYTETTTRDDSGRYVVMLPFNEKQDQLGESRQIAERQFLQIERRMQRDPEYATKYHAFMREYEQLGHMTRVENPAGTHYFLPHHAVTRPDQPSKFRVVFNASQKTTTGVSLNDTLYIGPPTQNDIFLLLLSFRRHLYGITCDAEKMYRQMLIHPSQRPYQLILYRYSQNEPIQVCQLNTVTYGTASAPWLAMRTTKQMVIDEGAKYPLAAEVFSDEIYVDDVLTGAASLPEAHKLIDELNQLASHGHFNLRKWCSNEPQALVNVSDKISSKHYDFDEEASVSKVLGMMWDTEADIFVFHANLPAIDGELTKRKLLSHLSRIFDPLGLISPIVIIAKCLLQDLWRQPIAWDDKLNDFIQQAYEMFRVTTNEQLHKIRIPRHVDFSPTVIFSLHGFCDASEKAYACCVYLNVTFESGKSLSHLLCSKTRVAPIKPVSLARLELCGAVILARAITKVATKYQCTIEQRFAYTDSTIVLAWLSKDARTWKTFVSNRVSEISDLLPVSQWRHVRSAHNSADIATRGATPDQLSQYTLWWNPPLPPPPSSFQPSTVKPAALSKEQKTVCLITSTTLSIKSHIIEKYSSHRKMLHVFGLINRAITRFKARNNKSNKQIHKMPLAERVKMVSLTVEELDCARLELIRGAQEKAYPDTFKRLREHRPLKKRDPLRRQSPKIDEKTGVLRVCGRLRKAELPHDTQNPIILPSKSNFTIALIRHLHKNNLHAGPTLVVSMIRYQYWILNIRDVVRRLTYRCVQCRRMNAISPLQQPTGDLPSCRVNPPPRPFTDVGIDYGGPINIRFSLARKSTSTKAYIALFVCMATKAVHLELVSDLSTDAFLAALERFIARRGLPDKIFSDNGTNFVGAARKLTEVEAFLKASKNDVTRHLADKRIEWHFIPPYAPNFGGVWEAGIKSAKRLLTNAMQGRLLTFEEVSTILAQAEAVLNSRPLTPTTSDDLEALTPGHFLIGASLLASPLSNAAGERLTLTKRWRMVQEVSQSFWSQWKRDYLAELHNRANTQPPTKLTVGEIVLIRDESSPLTWPKARIEGLHPGEDGIVRVVTLKTKSGSTKRAVSKLVRLLIDTP